MTDDVARVHYFARQFLRTQDFTDEQDYHLAAHRRHNIGGHTWGILVGLDLTAEGGNVWAGPGAAVDGYGRDLVLPDRLPVPPSAFDERNTDMLGVWLAYDRVAGDPAASGYAGCGKAGDIPFYRWSERPRLVLLPFDPYADPRKPDTVPEADRPFDPSRTPPDDPDQDWPVFLGTVTRNPANTAQPYVIGVGGRPYAGLVGRDIVAPSGRTRVQLDPENIDDDYRFAVYLADGEKLTGKELPRLAVARAVAGPAGAAEETLEIRGPTTLHGNLTLPGRAVAFDAGPERPGGNAVWGLYRTANPTAGIDELRVEIPSAPGGRKHQVVVGSWGKAVQPDGSEAEQFVPALTVDANGDVTVHGDLVVQGTIDNPQLISAELPDTVKNLALAGFLSGVGGASALLDRVYRSPFEERATGVPLLRAAVSLVATDDDRLADLTQMLADDPAAAERMRAALPPPPQGPVP
jgi:hypothetical protein